MLIKILLVLALVAVGFVVYVALKSGDFRVTRSVVISAPPAVVFPQVNDLHRFILWNPWSRLEPEAKVTFSGPPAGVGASQEWTGKKIGAGRMTILESRPDDRIVLKLEFLKPFAALNTAEFTFAAEAGSTRVSWSMWGVNNFMFKAVGVLVNTDKMLGDQFDQGLANLKAQVESPARN
jgi:uncharacterized protein YndB with AHSA1/START domain